MTQSGQLTTAAILALGVALGALSGLVQPAAAQTVAARPEPDQSITVTAPRLVVKRPAPTAAPPTDTTTTGIAIQVISLTRSVSYTDLDLTKPDDADAFEQRVRDIAVDACAQLEVAYPSSLYPAAPGDQNCVKTATDQAMVVADQIIRAAVMQVR